MRTAFLLLFCLGLAGPVSGVDGRQSGLEDCIRVLERAYDRAAKGEYSDAIRDFEAVAGACPSPDRRADANLRLGQIRLQQGLIAEAEARLKMIANNYLGSPAAIETNILRGRIVLAKGRTEADFQEAQRHFELAVGASGFMKPEALYYAGVAKQWAHRFGEGVELLREVTLRDPKSEWSAKALLRLAWDQVRSNEIESAFQTLKLVHNGFPATTEAGIAMEWSTILYRLHLRANARAVPFQFVSALGRSISSAGVAVIVGGQRPVIAVGHKAGWLVIDLNGTEVRVEPASETVHDVTAMAFSRNEDVIGIARISEISFDRKETPAWQPRIARGKTETSLLDIRGMATNWLGHWLLADAESRSVKRYAPGAKAVEDFSSVPATRLAVNELDDVYALIDRAKSIVVLDRKGGRIGEIPRQGLRPDKSVAYELDSPNDIALDKLGNLYVLDRGGAAVHVFGPGLNFVTTFESPRSGPGRFGEPAAIAVDAAGRLYILDDDTRRVLVYR